MSNQTLQRPPAKRRAKAAKNSKPYRRQTARLDGRRDGTPLIFGWGGHLTRTQKNQLQARAAYAFFGVVIVALLAVFVFGWIQQNYLIPNQAIVTVNSVGVTQDTYRKQLAYEAQTLWNTLQSELKQQATLQAQAQKGDTNAANQNTILTEHIQTDEANYAQSQLTQSAASLLVEDQLIRDGAKQFEQQNHVPAATFDPTTKDVNTALAAFKKAFPSNESYSSFLQKDNLTEADIRAAITLHLRRDKMQVYLSSLLVSPAKQAHIRKIETNTAADAQKVLVQLQKSPNDNALWTKLAKQDSLDPNSKDTGGDAGWIVNGQGDGVIDNWALASGHKAGDLSGVLKDASGTFDVVQVLDVDPSRAVDKTALQSAQSNALQFWLDTQKALPANHISTPDSTMESATRNIPTVPNLNAQLPNENPSSTPGAGTTGLPSGSGLPTGTGLP